MRAGRRTQVVKGAVCKTAMQRFDSARRLQNRPSYCSIVASPPSRPSAICLSEWLEHLLENGWLSAAARVWRGK